MISRTFLVVFTMLSHLLVLGQQGHPTQSDSVNAQSKKWFGYPTMGSSPETGFLLGGGFFHTIHEDDSTTRVSFLTGVLSASFKGYYIMNAAARHFTPQEDYLIEGDISYVNFPLRFYGIGNEIDTDIHDLYYSKTFSTQLLVYKKLRSFLFLGLGYRYGNVYDTRSDENGIMNALRPHGYRGHHFSGPQAGLLYDSRDNPIASTRGWFVKLSSSMLFSGFGSDYKFSSHTLDVRTYFKPIQVREDVLALQLFVKATLGDVPFTELSQMGGSSIMRGYYTGQYRDNHFVAMQTEYRYCVNGWLGIVAFIGVGSVMTEVSGVLEDIKKSYGGGMRFVLPASNRLVLRIDYGRGTDTGNLYIGLMQAF